MPIHAVVWDIDDTIFDYTGADRAALRGHLLEERPAVSRADAERALARWREITEVHWRRFEGGGVTFEAQRPDRVRDFLGVSLSDTEAEEWFARYVARYEAAWSLFPDALPALDVLAAVTRQAVLSNSAAHNQERKLRALGVRDRFEAVLCADEIGHAKPAPEAFHAVCAALGLPPERVAYVGDRLDTDATGAHEAGLRGVWGDRARATTQGDIPEGVLRVASLGDLPGLLGGAIGFGAPPHVG